MIGFFCTTPYHILLTISMALNEFKNDKLCLVVFKRFRDSDRIVKKLNEEKIFDKIITIDTLEFTSFKNWNRRYRMFRFYPQFKEVAQRECFKEFIFFAPDYIEVSFMIKLISKNSPRCIFSYGEDGIGTYIYDNIYEPNSRGRWWLNLLKRTKYLDKIKHIYVKYPELILNHQRYELKQINRTISEKFKAIILNIWPCNIELEKRIIFLQQPFQEDLNTSMARSQDKILKRLSTDFSDKFVVKLHPRTRYLPKDLSLEVLDFDGLVESLFLRSESVNGVIGINSSALFTPYLLFGKTIPIILLYKLSDYQELSKRMESFIYYFEKQFKADGGKLYIPKDYEELHRILEYLE